MDLRKLHEEATPAPWETGPYAGLPYYAELGYAKIEPRLFADPGDDGDSPFKEADAALIVAMRNALPVLLDVVDAARGLQVSILPDSDSPIWIGDATYGQLRATLDALDAEAE